MNFPIFGSDDGGFTFGMLRASQREFDKKYATGILPEYTFTNPQYLKAGETVQLDIALSPTSVKFYAGQTLSMVIANSNINAKKALYGDTVTEGAIILSTGGKYSSYIQLPIIEE